MKNDLNFMEIKDIATAKNLDQVCEMIAHNDKAKNHNILVRAKRREKEGTCDRDVNTFLA